jgi:putative SOS response-associated peptidase YedK
MCGRYRRTTREEELARIYRIPIPSQADLPISCNIASSQEVLAIRFNPETKQRSLDRLRWGLVPYWAKDEKIGFKTINARAETVDSAHSFRSAFKKRRCLVPADGFYKWRKSDWREDSVFDRDERRFTVRFFAGLWEGWQNPETQEWLRTCTIITGQPNELVAEIHTRMPVILPPETHDRWLSGEAGKEILRSFPGEEIKIRPVSTRINKPENNDPKLLQEGEMEQVGRLI